MLVGAGSIGSSVDAANIQNRRSPWRAQTIGDDWRVPPAHRNDAALERRFQPIVEEPTPEETINILQGIKRLRRTS